MDANKKELRRDKARQRRQQEALRNKVLSGLVVVAVLAAIYWAVDSMNSPTVGLEVEPMESAAHVAVGTKVEYNTSPPTSGMHYDQAMPAGFYEEADLLGLDYPEQYAVHSMEHGYVIIWYNCEAYAGDCNELKETLRAVHSESPAKVIALPWADMPEPVVLTSWTWMERFETVDEAGIRRYIRENRSHPRAPEYNVP